MGVGVGVGEEEEVEAIVRTGVGEVLLLKGALAVELAFLPLALVGSLATDPLT